MINLVLIYFPVAYFMKIYRDLYESKWRKPIIIYLHIIWCQLYFVHQTCT